MKKRTNRIRATWRNGRFEKLMLWTCDDLPVHTTPNHHPPKLDVLQKKFLSIILAAKWLVRHSKTSPQPAATTFAFPSVLIILLWHAYTHHGLEAGVELDQEGGAWVPWPGPASTVYDTPILTMVWKQEWSWTRKGGLSAMARTRFSTIVQSTSSSWSWQYPLF